MSLAWIETDNFRNLAGSRMAFGEPVTLFYGRNAQGKTSILEAIYMLGTTKSFREKKLANLVKVGETEAAVRGEVTGQYSNSEVELKLATNRRRFAKDGMECDLGDYLKTMPVVALSSEDMALIKGEPKSRRMYMDGTAALLLKTHMGALREFSTALSNRNELIRNYHSSRKTELEAWTKVFCASAAKVADARSRIVEKTRVTLKDLAKEMCVREGVDLAYKPSVCNHLLEDFEASLAIDIRRGMTHAGPHRDDMDMTIGGRPLSAFGSSGQIRAALWMLKLARVILVGKDHKQGVVFLLDDVEMHLDSVRLDDLMCLTEGRAQVFMTSTEPLEREKIAMRRYRVKAGAAVA